MPNLDAIRTAQYVYGLDVADFRRVAAVLRTGHTTRAAYVRDLDAAELLAYGHIRDCAQKRHMALCGPERANAGR